MRTGSGVFPTTSGDEPLLLLLRYADVRKAARDWETFSSDAPFRVPIPSEENLRKVRQLPIETDPPDHGDYRKIVEPVFARPRDPEFVGKIDRLIGRMIDEAAARDSVEIVREFALPLQSIALSYLLNVPESEAETWIGWGIHVFHDGEDGAGKGSKLDAYIDRMLDRAEEHPGDDFFSDLNRASYLGRPLTREERVGFANLTFAGGRDTVIHIIGCIIAYLAEHPEALIALRDDPKLIMTASEEFVRVLSPLTHIARQCPVETRVGDETVAAGGRISLCWASANRDETVFENPHDVRLDRRPNPHLGFGSGVHHCIGAAHTRLILRTLLKKLAERIETITRLEAVENVEAEAGFRRQVAYEVLKVRFAARPA